MTNSSFYTKFILALSAIVLISCDKDFNQLESDIIDDDIHSGMTRQEVAIVAHDRSTGEVQSNNATLNQLGVYDNPVFGKTVSHFVTQLEFASNNQNPSLFKPEVDSVYLYVPYFSTATGTASDNNETTTLYELDSIYGDKDAAFKLQVYENGYYLRDADPAAADGVQRYFSGDRAMVESLKVGNPLNNSTNTEENELFKFSPKEVVRRYQRPNGGALKTLERKAPGIYLNLDKTVIQQKIFNTDAANRLNNNVFKNYFRGLYFRVEQTGNAVMTMPKFAEGTVTIKYRDFPITTDTEGNVIADETKDKIVKTLVFNLTGNRINFFENTYNTAFTNAIATDDSAQGDEKLYVKGGAGSMAVLEIDEATIEGLKAQKNNILINEANIVFHIDDSETAMGKTVNGNKAIEPFRLYLYDLKNNQPIYDYYADASSSTSFPKYNKGILGGIVNATATKRGTQYKIRVTNYISQIVRGDSTNVKLGLVVTENINVISSNRLKTPFVEPSNKGDINVKWAPTGSVLHPFGTVLHGSTAADEKKRLKLEIYYTKPN